MNTYEPIIDVKPVSYSSERAQGWDSKTTPNAGASSATMSSGRALGGIAQIAVGVGLVALGIPMLVLPGPGLLSIAAGGLLINRGINRFRQ